MGYRDNGEEGRQALIEFANKLKQDSLGPRPIEEIISESMQKLDELARKFGWP